MQVFKFFQPYRKYIKTAAKNGGFCEDLLSESEFEAVLVNFCYVYIIVPMLLREFRQDTAGVMPTH